MADPVVFAKTPHSSHPEIELEWLASFKPGAVAVGGAEISAYDARSSRLFVTSAGDATLAVVDLSNPASPVILTNLPFGTTVTSVAVHKGKVAVAVPAEPKTDPGKVLLFDADFDPQDGPDYDEVTVGALPDMVAFTPDGKYLLVANEGEPNDAYTVDPEGSVSLIDIASCGRGGHRGHPGRRPRHGGEKVQATRLGFEAFNLGAPRHAELPAGVRVFGKNATVAQDLEPEYIAFSSDSRYAYVTLQENNAIAEIDIRRGFIKGIHDLGAKDFSRPENGFDASDKDKAIHIQPWPVRGLYLPDALAAFQYRGGTYIVTANEGDSRDYDGFSEEVRVKNLVLDPAVFPDASTLQKDPALGRLKVTSTLGDADGDGKYEAIYAFGGRSFSIWNEKLEQIYDSGDDIEQFIAAEYPDQFNSDNEANGTFDARSSSKGPEPEGVAVGEVKGRTYAFIGLERVGGVLVYDVTNPYAPAFKQYVNRRDFAGDVEAGTAGDVAPEGLLFVSKADSPRGEALLIVSHEVSGTVAIYRIRD